MKLFRQKVSEDQRLVILRLLNEQPDYSLNASLLQDGLAIVGHKISRDQVLGQLDWLSAQGLVTQRAEGAVRVATLTQDGVDVATGARVVTGVKRPRPEL
ncbi:MAG: hypothetical protein ACE5EM_01370 [Sphingomonadales bacterium]